MTITDKDTYYELQFPYNKIIINNLKNTFDCAVRSYNPQTKTWIIDKSEKARLKSFAHKFSFIWVKQPSEPQVDYGDIPPFPKLEVDPMDYFNMEPYPYQKDGMAYLLKNIKTLIGDEMGLGKSFQAIGSITISNAFPVLVICPASLKYNWQDEWMKFANIKSIVLKDSIKKTWPNYYKIMKIPVFITNYESLIKYFVVRMPKGDFKVKDIEFNQNITIFKSIIVDEAHRTKNGSTIQSKMTRAISSFIERRLYLTGTPIVNTPKDLIPLLSGLGMLKKFGGYSKFMERYCSKQTTQFDLDELNYKLRSTCFFMREKKHVLKELPEKTRQIVHCDITNRKEYEKAENDFINYLRENVGASDEQIAQSLKGEIMVKISHLKRLAAKGKIKDSVDYIKNINESGEKIIIFCWHKDIAKEIQKHFPDFKIIDGDVKAEDRHHYVTEFQNNESAKGIICTISTGGVGYNMTASSIVLFIELGWSPKDMDQAEDRSLRIGQKNAVNCPYMVGRNTIDEHIYQIIDKKRQVIKKTFGIKTEIETDTVQDIINIYKK